MKAGLSKLIYGSLRAVTTRSCPNGSARLPGALTGKSAAFGAWLSPVPSSRSDPSAGCGSARADLNGDRHDYVPQWEAGCERVCFDRRYRHTDVGGRYKIEGVPQGHQHMTIKSG